MSSALPAILAIIRTVGELADRYARAGMAMRSLESHLEMSAELIAKHIVNSSFVDDKMNQRIERTLAGIQEDLVCITAALDQRYCGVLPVGRLNFFLGGARMALARVTDLGTELENTLRVLELGLLASQSSRLDMLAGIGGMVSLRTDDHRCFWYNSFKDRSSVTVAMFAEALEAVIPDHECVTLQETTYIALSVSVEGMVHMKRFAAELDSGISVSDWLARRCEGSSLTCVTASHRRPVTCVARCAGLLLTASEDRVIKAFSELASGAFRVRQVMVGHEGCVSDMTAGGGDDDDTLFSCSASDRSVRKWNVRVGNEVACFRLKLRPERISAQTGPGAGSKSLLGFSRSIFPVSG
jgi:hypothetical protein